MITEINVKCFLSLANTLSFTKSASDLFMSQQAVSKNIVKLEEALETSLFIRDHHSVTLTATGRKYYELFYQLSRQFEAKKEEINNSVRINESPFRVGYQQYLDFSGLILNVQMKMREKASSFRHICYRLSPTDLVDSLMNERLDMIVIYKKFARNLLKCNTLNLCEAPNIMMISKVFPGADQAKSYLDFQDAPFIFDSVEESGKTGESIRRARSYIEGIGLYPGEISIVNNRETAYTAAEQGLGYVITTDFCHSKSSSLLMTFPVPSNETMMAIWRKDYEDQLTASEYAEALKKLLN